MSSSGSALVRNVLNLVGLEDCRKLDHCESADLAGLRLNFLGNPDVVPLYRCERCGWVTNAHLVDAVREHQATCPECAGTIRLVFDAGTAPSNPNR
jgi:hypothetical protein